LRRNHCPSARGSGWLSLCEPRFSPEGPIGPASVTGEVSLNLALALIASSTAPLLLLDKDLNLVTASASFCRCFQIDPAPGSSFSALGAGEWNFPQLVSLLKATAAGYADVAEYEFELVRPDQPPRCLVMNAHKLHYGQEDEVRLVLSVADVTEARARLNVGLTHATDPATILVVEDEAFIRMSTASMLEDAGFRVLEAQNSAEALEMLSQHSEISIMMTNVNMPGRMNGLGLVAQVRSDYPAIRSIVVSGNASAL